MIPKMSENSLVEEIKYILNPVRSAVIASMITYYMNLLNQKKKRGGANGK